MIALGALFEKTESQILDHTNYDLKKCGSARRSVSSGRHAITYVKNVLIRLFALWALRYNRGYNKEQPYRKKNQRALCESAPKGIVERVIYTILSWTSLGPFCIRVANLANYSVTDGKDDLGVDLIFRDDGLVTISRRNIWAKARHSLSFASWRSRRMSRAAAVARRGGACRPNDAPYIAVVRGRQKQARRAIDDTSSDFPDTFPTDIHKYC